MLIVLTYLNGLSGYLSQRELHDPQIPLEDVVYYTEEEIEAAERKDGIVYHQPKSMKEEVSEILIKGFDKTLVRKFGLNCDIKWLLEEFKDDFINEMDSTENKPLRQDYRSMAEVLGIPNNKVQQIKRRCRDKELSVTEEIIRYWCETSRLRMTFDRMLTMLHHPGMIGNETAAGSLQASLKQCGCEVGLRIVFFEFSSWLCVGNSVSQHKSHDFHWMAHLRKLL